MRKKEWKSNNIEKRNEKRLNNDVIFRLIKNTRRRINHKIEDNSQSKLSREILGIDVETYRKWLEYQVTPEMT